jgi:hypothetical protein
MGDQGGGRGCGTPVQKEKKKERKNSLYFSGIHIRCPRRTRGGPTSSVIVITGWAFSSGRKKRKKYFFFSVVFGQSGHSS